MAPKTIPSRSSGRRERFSLSQRHRLLCVYTSGFSSNIRDMDNFSRIGARRVTVLGAPTRAVRKIHKFRWTLAISCEAEYPVLALEKQAQSALHNGLGFACRAANRFKHVSHHSLNSLIFDRWASPPMQPTDTSPRSPAQWTKTRAVRLVPTSGFRGCERPVRSDGRCSSFRDGQPST